PRSLADPEPAWIVAVEGSSSQAFGWARRRRGGAIIPAATKPASEWAWSRERDSLDAGAGTHRTLARWSSTSATQVLPALGSRGESMSEDVKNERAEMAKGPSSSQSSQPDALMSEAVEKAISNVLPSSMERVLHEIGYSNVVLGVLHLLAAKSHDSYEDLL